jgi:inorganic pyrophosphatase
MLFWVACCSIDHGCDAAAPYQKSLQEVFKMSKVKLQKAEKDMVEHFAEEYKNLEKNFELFVHTKGLISVAGYGGLISNAALQAVTSFREK